VKKFYMQLVRTILCKLK